MQKNMIFPSRSQSSPELGAQNVSTKIQWKRLPTQWQCGRQAFVRWIILWFTVIYALQFVYVHTFYQQAFTEQTMYRCDQVPADLAPYQGLPLAIVKKVLPLWKNNQTDEFPPAVKFDQFEASFLQKYSRKPSRSSLGIIYLWQISKYTSRENRVPVSTAPMEDQVTVPDNLIMSQGSEEVMTQIRSSGLTQNLISEGQPPSLRRNNWRLTYTMVQGHGSDRSSSSPGGQVHVFEFKPNISSAFSQTTAPPTFRTKSPETQVPSPMERVTQNENQPLIYMPKTGTDQKRLQIMYDGSDNYVTPITDTKSHDKPLPYVRDHVKPQIPEMVAQWTDEKKLMPDHTIQTNERVDHVIDANQAMESKSALNHILKRTDKRVNKTETSEINILRKPIFTGTLELRQPETGNSTHTRRIPANKMDHHVKKEKTEYQTIQALTAGHLGKQGKTENQTMQALTAGHLGKQGKTENQTMQALTAGHLGKQGKTENQTMQALTAGHLGKQGKTENQTMQALTAGHLGKQGKTENQTMQALTAGHLEKQGKTENQTMQALTAGHLGKQGKTENQTMQALTAGHLGKQGKTENQTMQALTAGHLGKQGKTEHQTMQALTAGDKLAEHLIDGTHKMKQLTMGDTMEKQLNTGNQREVNGNRLPSAQFKTQIIKKSIEEQQHNTEQDSRSNGSFLEKKLPRCPIKYNATSCFFAFLTDATVKAEIQSSGELKEIVDDVRRGKILINGEVVHKWTTHHNNMFILQVDSHCRVIKRLSLDAPDVDATLFPNVTDLSPANIFLRNLPKRTLTIGVAYGKTVSIYKDHLGFREVDPFQGFINNRTVTAFISYKGYPGLGWKELSPSGYEYMAHEKSFSFGHEFEVKEKNQTYTEAVRNHQDVKLGGHWKPQMCTSRSRVAIIVPYRNREHHLPIFLDNIIAFLKKQLVEHKVYIVEQQEPDLFNRAALMNIGYMTAVEQGGFDCYVFHDVDQIPEDLSNWYHCSPYPRHLMGARSCKNYTLRFAEYFGGGISLTSDHIEDMNGFPNRWFGWGGEDDDILGRLVHVGHKNHRLPIEIGRYTSLDHPTEEDGNPHIHYNKLGHKIRAESASYIESDGVNSINYEKMTVRERELYTHISVRIPGPTAKEQENLWAAPKVRSRHLKSNDTQSSTSKHHHINLSNLFKLAAIILLAFCLGFYAASRYIR